jgi:hypothetical protein
VQAAHGAAFGSQGGEDSAKLVAQLSLGQLQPPGIEGGEVRVQRVDHGCERDVAFELGRPAAEHQMVAPLGAPAQLVQEAGLADPGLARDLDEARRRRLGETVEHTLELRQLFVSPDKRRTDGDHRATGSSLSCGLATSRYTTPVVTITPSTSGAAQTW